MAPQKSPAFQFYPKDFMAGTATMSLQEVGAYMRLLCYAWDAGSVPNDPNERARICGCSKAQERELFKKVGKKFFLQDDAFFNERLEEERRKQAEYRRRQSDKGKASAATRKQPSLNHGSTTVDSRLQPEGNSSSSSSSSSKEQEPRTTATPLSPRPLVSGESNPRTWGKIHGEHVAGFCDWVCLPEFLFAEFCRRSGQPDGGSAYVRGWAVSVRAKWVGPVGDNLKFWRDRWAESHVTAKVDAPKAAPIRIQDILDKEAAKKAGKAS